MNETAKATGENYGSRARRSAVWDFGGRLTIQGVVFASSLFLARLLTPADFGITTAARFFITLATRLTQLGLNASLVRMKELRPDHASSVFVVNLLAGALCFGALWMSSPWIGRYFGSNEVGAVLPYLAVTFLITPWGTVASAMLTRHLQYKHSTAIQVLDTVSGTLLTLGLAFFGWGYWSLVYGPLFGAVLSTSAKLYASPWRPSLLVTRRALSETIGFGLGFQAKNLLLFASANLDNVVVGRMLGVTSLGFYDKAYGLMHTLTNRMAFDASLMRILAIIQDEPDRFRRAVLKGIRATTLVSFPMLLTCACLAHLIVPVLFGDQWHAAVEPFRVLSIVGMFRSVMRPVHAANEALGAVWVQSAQQLVTVAVLVGGGAVGARYGGVVGVAAGVLLAEVIHALLAGDLLRRRSRVSPADLASACGPALLLSSFACASGLMVSVSLQSLGLLPALDLMAGVAVTVVTYAVLLLWTPFREQERVIMEIVDDLAPRLRSLLPLGILRRAPGKA
ncbi:lipopolysaccharide biosynthesis protein [Luteitalea sp.]|uniref:lipopolysaccharide biosynthesis protein n=1 Tax=Luteitalea sp. TaxID=2004800 RepID=UPI0025C6C93E|nr:lipopolysaccharide biosynthesis protein [Luteitalea sp.]